MVSCLKTIRETSPEFLHCRVHLRFYLRPALRFPVLLKTRLGSTTSLVTHRLNCYPCAISSSWDSTPPSSHHFLSSFPLLLLPLSKIKNSSPFPEITQSRLISSMRFRASEKLMAAQALCARSAGANAWEFWRFV